MKFGRNLSQHQVPDWSSEYINYKGLKKLIKAAAADNRNGKEADLAEFFFSLDRNLETVDGFYNKKYGESARRLKLLNDRYASTITSRLGPSHDEVEDLLGALLELRSQLRKLQWYGEVNRRGFTKITKKLDKKVPIACAQQRYLHLRVEPRAFATNTKLEKDMNDVNQWLSVLGEVNSGDESSPTIDSPSLSASTSRTNITLPSEVSDTLELAIQQDDFKQLESFFGNAAQDIQPDINAQKMLLTLLQRAVMCSSKRCISSLLKWIISFEDEDDIHARSFLHRIVITIARSQPVPSNQGNGSAVTRPDINGTIAPAEAPNVQTNPYLTRSPHIAARSKDSDLPIASLRYLLKNLSPMQQKALGIRDELGRLPIHYAAQYGSSSLCQIIINQMYSWGQFDVAKGADQPEWLDLDGHTPLHMAVVGVHLLAVQALLDATAFGSQSIEVNGTTRIRQPISGALLSTATKAGSFGIVKALVSAGADINAQDKAGETALHIAARLGYTNCAIPLLGGSRWCKAELDIADATFGWTPLLAASVDGQIEMVQLLADAGASISKLDSSGWTAKEHAALRGHLKIASLLADRATKSSASSVSDDANDVKSSPAPAEEKLNGDFSREIPGRRAPPLVRSFGHRYLTNHSMVLVSLGSMDNRKEVKPVKLDNIPFSDAHATQLDTALSLVVSASGATGDSTIIDLPVQENIATDPIVFTTTDVANVKMLFDIVPTYAGSKERVIGRGIACLSSIKADVGSGRMNLQGDVRVPIIAAKTLEFIGMVNFNFLVIRPFSHPNMSISESQTYWKSLTSPMVIGHRGLGKNMASRKSLQLGENTIQSFIAAANLGASYVEFDVQLTKDHVPVIYHDFLVSETGIDAPVHTLTLEQFLHINQNQHHITQRRADRQEEELSSNDTKAENPAQFVLPRTSRMRANSAGANSDIRNADMADRMKHTKAMKKNKGFKANSRGSTIQAPFTTLEEMFVKLPEHIGFNIEMKYPMLWESEQEEMDTYAVEMNSFVDVVLSKVYDLTKKRDILFSSFNPDICLLLSLKQPSIPVMFLTDAGASNVGDIRASSLQEAIRFASRWNLLGIVTAAEPLVTCPRLVRVVKESGLVCVSYGTLNNDSNNVNTQVNEGIDAVIVDSVLAIRKGLTHPPTAAEKALAATQSSLAGAVF